MTLVIRLLLKGLSLLPRRFLQATGSLIGSLNYVLNTRAAKVTAVNLELCGQDPGLRHESLRETGKTMMETPAVWLAPSARIDEWIANVKGGDYLRAAIEAGDGVLILLPHIGNWELFNVFYRRFGEMTALYQPPRNASLESLMKEVRGRHGNEMVSTDRRGLTRLYRALGEGRTVVVLPDQVPATGKYVPFFGVEALTDELSPRLLRKSGARALLLSIIRRADGRFKIQIEPADDVIYQTDVKLAARGVNALVERSVGLAPAQYQWEYKRFRERPAGEVKVYRFNKPVERHA